jgi:hypothetical protein
MRTMNKVDYTRHPREIPDTDAGNLRLYYELELLRSEYEACKCPTKLQRYTQVIDTLGERGQYVPFNTDLAIDKDLRKYDFYDMLTKPIPTPGEGESQSDYISRCMEAIGGEYEDKKQAVAICGSTWRKHRRKK